MLDYRVRDVAGRAATTEAIGAIEAVPAPIAGVVALTRTPVIEWGVICSRLGGADP